jgi:hypothetical protein
MSTHEEGALVLPCDSEERPLMLEARPDVFYVTPHYEGAPYVLARLDAIDREELLGRLEDAYEIVRLREPRPRRAAGGATRSARRRQRPS